MENQSRDIYPIVFECGFDKPLSNEVLANHLAVIILVVLLTISTMLLNSITSITYWKSSRLKEKKTYFMIMVLSLNDLTVGVGSNSMFLRTVGAEYSLSRTQCDLYASEFYLHMFSSGCSAMTLVMMSIERYVGICHPIYHRTKVTKVLLMKYLVFLWISIGVVTIASIWTLFSVILPAIFLTIMSLFFIYGRVFLTVYRQSSIKIHYNQSTHCQEQRDLLKNRKMAKSCLIIVLSFTFCYLPILMLKIIDPHVVEINPDSSFILTRWSIAFISLNSSVNSIVFFWRNKILREEAFVVIKKLTQSN